MSWLQRFLRPEIAKEQQDVKQAANEAIEAATKAVNASVLARRKVLELELKLRRR